MYIRLETDDKQQVASIFAGDFWREYMTRAELQSRIDALVSRFWKEIDPQA